LQNKLYPLIFVADLFHKSAIAATPIAEPTILTTENRVLLFTWLVVFGLATESGIDFMTAMPFQDDPTTDPTLPENPPRIPCLIVPIFLNCYNGFCTIAYA
jgi:hypothetical protein